MIGGDAEQKAASERNTARSALKRYESSLVNQTIEPVGKGCVDDGAARKGDPPGAICTTTHSSWLLGLMG